MSAVVVAPPTAQTRRGGFRLRPSRAVLDIVLAVVAIFWLVPTIGLTIISLRPERFFQQSGWWTVLGAPAQLTLQNYATLFSQGLVPGGVLDSLTTSIAITVPATLLVAIISSLAAYSLVFGRWRGRDVVFLAVVGLLVVPLQVALIPVVQMFRGFGGLTGFNPYGTVLGVVIFHVAFGLPFGIFLMRNFLAGIPTELMEAGRIDGAGQWTLFQRVVMPLSLPAAMSLAIFQFIWVWNDLLIALVFLGGNPHHPLTIFLYDQTRTLAANYWVISTGAMISILIPLIVFFSLQRYFVQGVLAGAVK
ncbi:MAG TPA: carbohydrate ABC transporter permease [Candidatus Dormibacteraeota bacterium]|jgi:alpha-glucoside transport system permease protein|nr:carbohydrate ABC transporter permease [Candidatus Dormibacteraeota bacterium]